MTAERWTIGQLAERANVTPRTIRYYTAEGLLPPPETRGRYAVYNQDHLHRLQLIARLKVAHLPLHTIRERVAALSAQEVESVLHEPTPEPSSAVDYIAHVLAQHATPDVPPRLREHPALPLSEPLREHSPLQAELRAPAASVARSAAVRSAQPAGRPRASHFLNPRTAPPATEAAIDQTLPVEVWQRLELAPGVELHVREPISADVRARIDQLLARAREVFTAS